MSRGQPPGTGSARKQSRIARVMKGAWKADGAGWRGVIKVLQGATKERQRRRSEEVRGGSKPRLVTGSTHSLSKLFEPAKSLRADSMNPGLESLLSSSSSLMCRLGHLPGPWLQCRRVTELQSFICEPSTLPPPEAPFPVLLSAALSFPEPSCLLSSFCTLVEGSKDFVTTPPCCLTHADPSAATSAL